MKRFKYWLRQHPNIWLLLWFLVSANYLFIWLVPAIFGSPAECELIYAIAGLTLVVGSCIDFTIDIFREYRFRKEGLPDGAKTE